MALHLRDERAEAQRDVPPELPLRHRLQRHGLNLCEGQGEALVHGAQGLVLRLLVLPVTAGAAPGALRLVVGKLRPGVVERVPERDAVRGRLAEELLEQVLQLRGGLLWLCGWMGRSIERNVCICAGV